jgi:hypothetical protein
MGSYDAIVRLLLDQGADVHVQGRHFGNTLAGGVSGRSRVSGTAATGERS